MTDEELAGRFAQLEERIRIVEAQISGIGREVREAETRLRTDILAEMRKHHAEQMRAFQSVVEEVRGERDRRTAERFEALERRMADLERAVRA